MYDSSAHALFEERVLLSKYYMVGINVIYDILFLLLFYKLGSSDVITLTETFCRSPPPAYRGFHCLAQQGKRGRPFGVVPVF